MKRAADLIGRLRTVVGSMLATAALGQRFRTLMPAPFCDSKNEESFLFDYRRSGAQFTTLACLAGAGMALAFAVLMNAVPDRDINQVARQTIRVALAFFLSGAALFISVFPRTVDRHYILAVGLPACLGCFTVAALGFLPTEMEYPRSGRLTVAMCLTCFLVYGFTRLPAAMMAVMCSMASALAVIASHRNGDDYPEALVIYLTITNLSGFILSIQIEKREREIFKKTLDLTIVTERLEASARASEEASAAKSHVLAAVSHDLRQPLTSMSLYLAALRESASNDEARVARAMGQVEECVAAMSDNLSRLSNIAELQDRNEALPVETVDLFVVLRRLSSVYGGQADGKGVRLVVRLPEPGALLAASDGARLWEILSNLVSNAIKFSDTGRPGWVLVRAVSVGDTLRVTIRDNGVGIDPRFHRRIFDEYFQVGNPQRDRGKGYGLGLSIVRETVSRLSGHRLFMRSACGQGSRFDLFIPKARADDPLPTVPTSRPVNLAATDAEGLCTAAGAFDGSNPLQGRYALLVEDDVAARQALTETMEGWGMLVEAVGSPEEALSAVRQAERFFDVVVSDFNLPGPTDGVGVVDAVRLEQGQRTPAIIVSGRLAAIDPGRLRKVDARTMTKPLDPVQLRSELESCVAA